MEKNSGKKNTNRDDKNFSTPNFLMITIITLILQSHYWSAKLSVKVYVNYLIKIQTLLAVPDAALLLKL
jgi:hypothetical protein